jgi:GxxExxY protein
MVELVHKELSYRIIGALFEAYNRLGYGYQEKYYQKAVAECLREKGLLFIEQAPYKVRMRDKIIGQYFVDFVIENSVVLEIKKAERFSKQNIEQVGGYLKVTGLELAILANFTPTGIKAKRMLNLKNYHRSNS